MTSALRYRLPILVVRDTQGRLLGWWPDISGRPFGAWLALELSQRLEDEDGVGLALFILYGAAPSGRLALQRATPWGGVLAGAERPVLTYDQIIGPPAGVSA